MHGYRLVEWAQSSHLLYLEGCNYRLFLAEHLRCVWW